MMFSFLVASSNLLENKHVYIILIYTYTFKKLYITFEVELREQYKINKTDFNFAEV